MSEFKVVTFKIGEQNFAMDITNVETVVEMMPITKLPSAPKDIEGIINLRGEVIPVVDGAKKLTNKSLQSGKKIIVVNSDNGKYGLIADEVEQVMGVTENEIEQLEMCKSRYIAGIIKKGEKLVVLLHSDLLVIN